MIYKWYNKSTSAQIQIKSKLANVVTLSDYYLHWRTTTACWICWQQHGDSIRCASVGLWRCLHGNCYRHRSEHKILGGSWSVPSKGCNGHTGLQQLVSNCFAICSNEKLGVRLANVLGAEERDSIEQRTVHLLWQPPEKTMKQCENPPNLREISLATQKYSENWWRSSSDMLKGVSPWLFLFAYHKHPICSPEPQRSGQQPTWNLPGTVGNCWWAIAYSFTRCFKYMQVLE